MIPIIKPEILLELINELKRHNADEALINTFQKRCGILNQLISEYNTPEKTPSIIQLDRIKLELNRLINLLPHKLVLHSSPLQNMFHDTLVVSLHQNYDQLQNTPSSIEDRITRKIGLLTRAQAQLWAEKLSCGKIPEALCNDSTYTISYLGGKNSRNYLVTPTIPHEKRFVLKLEYRLLQSRFEEERFRAIKSLQPVFTPVREIRQIAHKSIGMAIISQFMTTAYCAKGTPIEVAAKIREDYTPLNLELLLTTLMSTACNIYEKMANILSELEKNNIAFPDAKNTNWLLDEFDNVHISDTKSLISMTTATFANVHPIVSSHMQPPECIRGWQDAQPVATHAYFLGKNLYQFLCEMSNQELTKIALQQDFLCHKKGLDSQKVFDSQKGLELKLLILKLTMDDPSERINSEKAAQEIRRIQDNGPRPIATTLAEIKIIKELPYKKQKTLLETYENHLNQYANEIECYEVYLDNIDKTKETYNMYAVFFQNTQEEAQQQQKLLTPRTLDSLKNRLGYIEKSRNKLQAQIRNACQQRIEHIKDSYRYLNINTAVLRQQKFNTPFIQLILDLEALEHTLLSDKSPLKPNFLKQLDRLTIIEKIMTEDPAIDAPHQQMQPILIFFQELKQNPRFTAYAEANIKQILLLQSKFESNYQKLNPYYTTKLLPSLNEQISIIKNGDHNKVTALLVNFENEQQLKESVELAREQFQILDDDQYNPSHYESLSEILSLLKQFPEQARKSRLCIEQIGNIIENFQSDYSDDQIRKEMFRHILDWFNAYASIKAICEQGIAIFKTRWTQALLSCIELLKEKDAKPSQDTITSISNLETILQKIETNDILIYKKEVQEEIQAIIDKALSFLHQTRRHTTSFFKEPSPPKSPSGKQNIRKSIIGGDNNSPNTSSSKIPTKPSEAKLQDEPQNKDDNHARKI